VIPVTTTSTIAVGLVIALSTGVWVHSGLLISLTGSYVNSRAVWHSVLEETRFAGPPKRGRPFTTED
jgi:hypothetical protein